MQRAGSGLVVYAHMPSFFRDWAAARLRFAQMHRVHGFIEPKDNLIPGMLIVGDPTSATIPLDAAEELVPGPGLDKRVLQRMVFRSARLPRVRGGA